MFGVFLEDLSSSYLSPPPFRIGMAFFGLEWGLL
jgi:hypothetical protein